VWAPECLNVKKLKGWVNNNYYYYYTKIYNAHIVKH